MTLAKNPLPLTLVGDPHNGATHSLAEPGGHSDPWPQRAADVRDQTD
jgi:hypothetical protein